MRFRSLGLLAVMTMVVASCGVAPQSSGPTEGIAVHGDWTIEVYNEDGTLDERVEFSNAFVGEFVLSDLLVGKRTPGDWRIFFGEELESTVCPSTVFGKCSIDAEAETTQAGDVRLTGSTTVEEEGLVDTVSTELDLCGSDVSPDGCRISSSGLAPFTSKYLDEADRVTVSAGQVVQVEVVISFTSG